jgi:hypothetical protein
MAIKHMSAARVAKNDEFYTQFNDIQKEVNAYIDYDKNTFKDKIILCPCDNPETSEFVKFFILNFNRFGLKKLICTSYIKNGKGRLFETDHEFDPVKITWTELNGDGDFRSEEVTKFRDESDIIITNPPFSLFREFIQWIKEKQFLILGSINAISYKEIFPLIKDTKVCIGKTFNEVLLFRQPNTQELRKMSGIVWFTNLMHGRRNEKIKYMTMADNLKCNKRLVGTDAYKKYDNYDAIEIPFSNAIPSDYNGYMGVPISWLGSYNPEQFEIIGPFNNGIQGKELGAKKIEIITSGKSMLSYGPVINKRAVYARIIIKHRKINI